MTYLWHSAVTSWNAVLFIVSLCSATLSHRTLASAGTFCGSFRVQGHHKFDILYVLTSRLINARASSCVGWLQQEAVNPPETLAIQTCLDMNWWGREKEQPEDALDRRQEFQPLLVWARQKPSLEFGVTPLYFITDWCNSSIRNINICIRYLFARMYCTVRKIPLHQGLQIGGPRAAWDPPVLFKWPLHLFYSNYRMRSGTESKFCLMYIILKKIFINDHKGSKRFAIPRWLRTTGFGEDKANR